MDGIDLQELKEICDEYEISTDDFNEIVDEALNLRVFDGKTLDDNQIFEIIKLAIEVYDDDITPSISGIKETKDMKSVRGAVELAAHKILDKATFEDTRPDYNYSDENRHI